MAHEEDTKKSPEELAKRAWDLAKSIRTCSLVTFDGDLPKARPMSAHVESETKRVLFLASSRSDTVDQLARHAGSTVMFADTGSNKYVTFSGAATVSNDRAKIRELWTPFAKAWWDSAEDPDIRLLQLNPSKAELWDGPNKLIAFAIMAAAAISNSKPAVGDHAQITP